MTTESQASAHRIPAGAHPPRPSAPWSGNPDAEQIRLLYRQTASALIGGLLLALIVSAYLWSFVPLAALALWTGTVLAIGLVRLHRVRRFQRETPADDDLRRWLVQHQLLGFAGGAAWGALGLLYDPALSTEQQLVVFVVLAGLATGAISPYSAVFRAYLLFATPLLLPLAGHLLWIGSQATTTLGFIVLLFWGVLLVVARQFNANMISGLRMARERQALIQAYSEGAERLSRTEHALRESETRFGTVLESSLDGFWDWDIAADHLYLSPRWKQQLGYEDHELASELATWESHLHPEDHDPMLAKVRAFLAQPSEGWEEEFRLRHKDGSYKWILARAAPTLDKHGRLCRLTGVHIDITDRVETARRLREREQHISLLLESTGEGLLALDPAGACTMCNPAGARLLGCERPEEVVGRALPELVDAARNDADPAPRSARIDAVRDTGVPLYDVQDVFRRRDGSRFPVEYTAHPMRQGEDIVGVVISFTDITERREAERRIKHLAYHDALTGLPNRLLFNDRVRHALAQAQRTGNRVAVLFIDLDRFKNINDSLGHPAGDRLLQVVAQRLGTCVRRSDTIARFGGDEFAVVAENLAGTPNVRQIAEKLLTNLREPFKEAGRELYIGASIGVSVFPDDGSDADTLLRNADAAMYAAKNGGRDQVRFYTRELTSTALRYVTMESSLREALQKRQFELHFQPEVCLQSDRIVGAEALLRWRHPERGYVSPDELIPIAEEAGLIVPLGEWVLENACREACRWREQGLDLAYMAVNLSGVQIQREHFVEGVKDILTRTGLPPERLELEITENFLMRDAAASARLLQELRRLGSSIAIDDFGTGYSSLSQLTRFPLNKLKIDRSFVADLCDNRQNAEIVRAIIGLGKTLCMRVVAEGIETESQLEYLRALGCDEGQGYLFGKPLPADAFVRHVEHFDQVRARARRARSSPPASIAGAPPWGVTTARAL